MILPPALWDLPDDSVAVEIDGITFLETPEEAARMVAKGVAKLLKPDLINQEQIQLPDCIFPPVILAVTLINL